MSYLRIICPVCRKEVSNSGAPKVAHLRQHVREGKVIEDLGWSDGDPIGRFQLPNGDPLPWGDPFEEGGPRPGTIELSGEVDGKDVAIALEQAFKQALPDRVELVADPAQPGKLEAFITVYHPDRRMRVSELAAEFNLLERRIRTLEQATRETGQQGAGTMDPGAGEASGGQRVQWPPHDDPHCAAEMQLDLGKGEYDCPRCGATGPITVAQGVAMILRTLYP